MQHAAAVKLMSDTGQQPAIEAEEGGDKLAGLRAKIKQLKPGGESTQGREEAKAQS